MQQFSRALLLSSLCTVFGLFCAKEEKKMTDSKTAATPKIAVVNVHRIITDDPKGIATSSLEWRALFDKLQETLKPAKKEISDLEEKFKKTVSEIETLQKTGVASKDTLQKKVDEEIVPLRQQMQGQYEQVNAFYQQELAKAHTVVWPKIEKIFEEIQAAQGWDIILRGDTVLGKTSKRFDLTDEVLATLNKRYSEEKDKKPATAVSK